jgi:signal transduction histidine kinase
MNIRANDLKTSNSGKIAPSQIFPSTNMPKNSSRFEQDFGLFDSVFHEVSDAIIIIASDINGCPIIEDVNHQFEVITDHELSEIHGNNLFNFLQMKNAPYQQEVIGDAIKNRQTAVITCEWQKDDLCMMNINLTLRPFNNEGENNRFICILREEKTDEQIRNEAAKEIKGKLLAAMNHKFRTPLNGILGFSEIIMTEMLGPIDKERYKDYAKNIHGAGQDLLTLINNLLDLQALESPELDLHEEKIEVNDLVKKSCEPFNEEAKIREIELSSQICEKEPIITADKGRMEIVMSCLLDNALKFTNKGGEIKLTSEKQKDGGCIITCSDNGHGMLPQQVAKAFSHDTHLADIYNNPSTGIGYGLAYVKKIIERHNGSVTIISAVGEGTSVSLHLPAS